MRRFGLGRVLSCLLLLASSGCRRDAPASSALPGAGPEKPSILLITLDTTRADAIGPEAVGVRTPAFDADASRGRLFHPAYATVPETLP